MNNEVHSYTQRLEQCYTGIIHDIMRDKGFKNFVLPPDIRPLIPQKKVCGPIFTFSGRRVQADTHQTLLEWTKFLSQAEPGSVVVCQPNDSQIALMGELSAETLIHRKIRGYIVDGGCRDTDFIIKLGFPVYHRFFTPKDIVGVWLPNGFNIPIRIGDTNIFPGDYVLGDRDGVIVIPRKPFPEILAAAEASIKKENSVRKAILEGMNPQDAYLKYGKF